MTYHNSPQSVWLTAQRYNDTQYTISLHPPLLKALAVWSDRENVSISVDKTGLYIYLEPHKNKNTKTIKSVNMVTHEKTDRTKTLDFLYEFKTPRTTALFTPHLEDAVFRAKDFCSCRSEHCRKDLDIPYVKVTFDGEFSPWEVGWCVK